MAKGPNKQSRKFNLPSPHSRVEDQVSSFIKRGLNLASEIEATLDSPTADLEQEQGLYPEHQASNTPNNRTLQEKRKSSNYHFSETPTTIQPSPSAKPTLKTEETDASWAMVWFRRGMHKFSQEDYSGAQENFKQALQKHPTFVAAFNGLGGVLYQHREFVEAVAAYNQALDYEPQNAHIYCNLGSALYKIQNFDEAALAYQQAIHFNPYLQVAYYGLGLAHSQIGCHQEAVTAFTQATQLDFQHADSFLGLGTTLYALGDIQEALMALRQAMHLNPYYIETYLKFHTFLSSSVHSH